MFRLFALALAVACFGHVISSPVNACASPCKDFWTAVKCGLLAHCKATAWKKAELPASVNAVAVAPSPAVTPAAASPVSVTLYFEFLCPGCKQFIQYQVTPAFAKLASTGILDMKFVPYGNAREIPYGSSYYYQCQHGPAECRGNQIEACAMQLYQSQDQYVNFITCIEQYGEYYGSCCATQHKMDYNKITTCADGAEGLSLMHEMAVATAALNPPHQYVPWVTVNGQHTDAMQTDIMNDMTSFVCRTYTGTKPDVCSQYLNKHNVCYKAAGVAA